MKTERIIAHWPVGVATATVSAAIAWLTLAPHPLPDNDMQLFPGADKVVHALMFAALYSAMAFDTMLRSSHRGKPVAIPLAVSLLLAAIAIAAGGLVEVAQQAMGMGRTGDGWDFWADAVGVILAIFPANVALRKLLNFDK